jgi:DNA-binding NarL/FixJ family response regulator
VPPEILDRTRPASPATARPEQAPTAADLGLTERQMDVLALMMQGKSNKAICRVLDLAEPTVKNHVTAILKALKASNRTEAVIAAGARGLGR